MNVLEKVKATDVEARGRGQWYVDHKVQGRLACVSDLYVQGDLSYSDPYFQGWQSNKKMLDHLAMIRDKGRVVLCKNDPVTGDHIDYIAIWEVRDARIENDCLRLRFVRNLSAL